MFIRDRVQFLATTWLLCLLATLGCDSPQRYNVVLITLDTTRADRLSGYGYERITTPALDDLLVDAVRFDHAMAPTGFTVPSHASILTGLYPAGHGAVSNGWVLPESSRTLAEHFRDAGYRTGGFVAARWVLGARFGFARGFDVFKEGSADQRDAAEITSEAVEFLQVATDEPFFLWAHYYDPHCPYTPASASRELFAAGIDSEVDQRGQCGKDSFNLMKLEDDDVALIHALYDAELHGMDQEIGRLIAHLREQELLESTVFVITADHGEELHDAGRFGHNYTVREWETHVPLWLRLPAQLEHDRSAVAMPVSLVDIAPTLVKLTGIEAPAATDGVDLLAGTDHAVFARISPEAGAVDQVAVRSSNWKLVFTPGLDDAELYDIERDGGELHDLAEELPEVRDRLLRLTNDWLREQGERVRAHSLQTVDDETMERLESLGYVGQ